MKADARYEKYISENNLPFHISYFVSHHRAWGFVIPEAETDNKFLKLFYKLFSNTNMKMNTLPFPGKYFLWALSTAYFLKKLTL